MIDWRDRINIIGAVAVSLIVTLAFGAVCIALFFFEIPAGSVRTADTLFGFLGAAFIAITQYWTGSSSGNQKKDAIISDAAKVAAAKLP